MQFDAQAGLQERAGHPGGCQPQQATGARQLGFDFGLGVALDGFQWGDRVHG